MLGVRDYINKHNFSGAVIGLSGGIDSALTLAIAVDAIGADKVEALMMPSRYTADMSKEDARAEAEALGVSYDEISIELPFAAFLEVLEEAFSGMAARYNRREHPGALSRNNPDGNVEQETQDIADNR